MVAELCLVVPTSIPTAGQAACTRQVESTLEDGSCGTDRLLESHTVPEGFVTVCEDLSDPRIHTQSLQEEG